MSNEEYKDLKNENWGLKVKMEELRKEFSRISSNVINNMNERDIHSKQLLTENEQLLRRKNINTIDFQSLEQKYQSRINELKKDLRFFIYFFCSFSCYIVQIKAKAKRKF